jgi:hypothetical protein
MSLSNGNGNANGSALPVVHGLPSPRAAAYSPATTKRALSKRPALPAPNPIEVWASLMDLSKGRDKVLVSRV